MNSEDSDRDVLVRNEEHEDEDGGEEFVENSSNSLGFWAVIFLTVNATLGAGMLNIPYAFISSGGLLSSSILHFVSCV